MKYLGRGGREAITVHVDGKRIPIEIHGDCLKRASPDGRWLGGRASLLLESGAWLKSRCSTRRYFDALV